jgi:uncharacterized protein
VALVPVTTNPADYAPGDIDSHRLQGPYRTRVAIGSDRTTGTAADRDPLAIHNRGLGMQEGDCLFAAHITGHYRYNPKILPNLDP